MRRAVVLVAACSLFWGAFQTSLPAQDQPLLRGAALLGFALAVAVAVTASLARTSRQFAVAEALLLAAGFTVLAGWVGCRLLHQGGASDEGALVQGAARMLLHGGGSPYAADLTGALADGRVPPALRTPLLGGGVAHTLGYPGLAVLGTADLMLLGAGSVSLDLLVGLALAASVLELFVLLPRPWRGLAVLLVVGLPAQVEFGMGGLAAVLILPGLIAAAAGWTRTGRGGRLGARGTAAAFGLGLALAAHQLAWFVLPFLLSGLLLLRWAELGARRGAAVVGRYAGLALLVVAVADAPFLLTDPGRWGSGVVAPLVQQAVPLGFGLVGVPAATGAGIGSVGLYSLAAALAAVCLGALYLCFFRTLAPACFLLPALPLLLAPRSLAHYVTVPAVLWAAAALTPQQDLSGVRQFGDRLPTAWRRLLAGVLLGLPAAACVWAVATPQPLVLTPAGPFDRVSGQVTVRVANTTGGPLRPRFTVDDRWTPTAPYWNVLRGPAELPPHGTGEYLLAVPDLSQLPPPDSGFAVEAVTDSPATVSWSAYRPAPPFPAAPAAPAAR